MEYKKEKETIATDNLSRRDEAERRDEVEVSTLLVVTTVESDWVERVRTMVKTEEYFQEFKTKGEAARLAL